MNEEKIKRILADIKKTGFVSELNTASEFLKNGWKVSHNSSYLDKDQEKSREIDLTARKFDFEPKFRFRQEFYVAVEIKSSEKPWVVFASTKTDDSTSSKDWENLFAAENLLIWRHLNTDEIKKGYMRASYDRIGTAFHEVFKSPSQPSQIFEAVISSCKAVTFMKDSFVEVRGITSAENTSYNPKEYHFLGIFIPLIVVDGELYEARLDEKGELVIEDKDFLPLRFSYSSPKYRRQLQLSSESLNYITFFPDIVTLKGLGSYLEKLDYWRDIVFNEIQMQIDNDEWFAEPS